MGIFQGDTLLTKILAGIAVALLSALLLSGASDLNKGSRAYEQLQEIKPEVKSLRLDVDSLKRAPEEWKNAAKEVLDEAYEKYDRMAYRDSVRYAERESNHKK